ncbi:MAG TPA: FtsQ-type POTRA domain-containing protein [Acidimicrobiales bacterium]|nr:FtsQ-type POTRA domain-containing protein [Acidimicrobiales bacterium]
MSTLTSGATPAPRIDPRMARRVVEVRRAEGRRRLRVLVGAAVVAGTVAAAAAVAESPLGAVRHVRVSGASGATAAAVAAASGIGTSTPMLHLRAAAAVTRVEAVPVVASATVSRQWPATVRIAVTLRTPVAAFQTPAGPALVDRTGRVVGLGGPAAATLPTIELAGAPTAPAPGRWLPGAPGRAASPTASSAAGPAVTPVARELALAALLPAGATPAPVLSVGADGLDATIGATTVIFGAGDQLPAQVAALAAVEAATPLGARGTLDLSVPDRPVLALDTPGSLTAGGAASSVSTQTRG